MTTKEDELRGLVREVVEAVDGGKGMPLGWMARAREAIGGAPAPAVKVTLRAVREDEKPKHGVRVGLNGKMRK